MMLGALLMNIFISCLLGLHDESAMHATVSSIDRLKSLDPFRRRFYADFLDALRMEHLTDSLLPTDQHSEVGFCNSVDVFCMLSKEFLVP